MSHPVLAKQGYATIQKQLTSDKSIERQIFGKITSALQAVDPAKPSAAADLAEAITKNTKLWNLILIDLVNPDNKLPMALKTNLIGLAEFVQIHSLKVLEGSASYQVLIDINKSIMAGLAGKTEPVIKLAHLEAA